MRLNIVCFVAGVWLLQLQAVLPAPGWVWLPAGLGLAGVLAHFGGLALRATREALIKAACFALGFAWAAWCAQVRLADALPPDWEGRDISVVGVVASLPQIDDKSVRFDFDLEAVVTPGAKAPRHIALSWWGSAARAGSSITPPARTDDDDAGTPAASAAPPVRAGERWQLTVRLRRPHGTANPHGFDYEAWLLERGLRATGYVRAGAGNSRLASMVHEPRYWIERIRGFVRARIQSALADASCGGIIIALAIGDQRAIGREQWQVFTRTGVNHLMSISGLHVTMVSGLVFACVGGCWRRSPRLTLRLPAHKAAAAAGFGAALMYSLLAGFAVPAQRTVYMLAVVAAALWLGTTGSASAVLAVALLAVVLLDPWAVLAPGFWLSFGAVAVILYVSAGRVARPHWLQGWARVQAAVTLALIPPLLALFQQASVVSPVANAVAIPVVSLIVAPLALIGAAVPFDFILQAAHLVMAWCMALLEILSALPVAVWQQHAPPAWAVAVAVAALAWQLAPRGIPARWVGVAGLVPLFWVAPAALRAGDVEIVVLDVGQGVAAMVRTAHHALIYDSGPAFASGADSGSRIIVPFLRAAGVGRLEGVILSHDDTDHTGGAASVLQAVPVEWLLTSLPDLDPLMLQAEHAFRCYAGQSWERDGVRFEILHPSISSYDKRSVRDNDRSCVLRIESRGGRALFPADIERRSERELVRGARDALRAEVLIAPHQGSRTSSTPDFVAAVNPRLVVFPVGYRNRFGHPHEEVISRYRDMGTRIYRTDRDGALTITIRAEGTISIVPYRARYRRYWQSPMEGDSVPDPGEFRIDELRTKNDERRIHRESSVHRSAFIVAVGGDGNR